jgi:hypothetical protein
MWHMTREQIIYTVAIGLLIFFLGWIITPVLDRMRDKFRERASKSELTPDTEANMLKQLRMQQASLKRLEQFQANPTDVSRYLMGLLASSLLLFSVSVYIPLYLSRLSSPILGLLPVVLSLLFFFIIIVECRNMTNAKMNESIGKLRHNIEEVKAKLKILE